MTRRSLLEFLVAGVSLTIGGVIGWPALVAALSPALRRRSTTNWRPIGQISDFPVGELREAICSPDPARWPRTFSQQIVFVWRMSENDFVIYSRSCTDLGCGLTYDAGSGCFLCPCHGGIFNQHGQRLAGPPGRPMHRYAHRVLDSVLEIDLASIPTSA